MVEDWLSQYEKRALTAIKKGDFRTHFMFIYRNIEKMKNCDKKTLNSYRNLKQIQYCDKKGKLWPKFEGYLSQNRLVIAIAINGRIKQG